VPDDDPPGRLVLERVLTQGEEEYARRVTDDGRVWARSTRSARLDDDGEWHFGPGDNAWRELATLPADAFNTLQASIRDSGILDAAPDYGPPTTFPDGSQERWTADLDGRRITTLLRGVPEVEVPAVTAVADALHEALAAADQA
jgi:hypothetical protein